MRGLVAILILILLGASRPSFAAEEECELALQTAFARGTSRLLRLGEITPEAVRAMIDSVTPLNPLAGQRPTVATAAAHRFYAQNLALTYTQFHWGEIRNELGALLNRSSAWREVRDEAYAYTAAILEPREVQAAKIPLDEVWQWLKTRDGRLLYVLWFRDVIEVRDILDGSKVLRFELPETRNLSQIVEDANGDLVAVYFGQEAKPRRWYQRMWQAPETELWVYSVNLRTGMKSGVQRFVLPVEREYFSLVKAQQGPDLASARVLGTLTASPQVFSAPEKDRTFSIKRGFDGSNLIVEQITETGNEKTYTSNVYTFDGQVYRLANTRPFRIGDVLTDLALTQLPDGRFAFLGTDVILRGKKQTDRLLFLPPALDGGQLPLELKTTGRAYQHSMLTTGDGRLLVLASVSGNPQSVQIFEPARGAKPLFTAEIPNGVAVTTKLREVNGRLFLAVMQDQKKVELFEPLYREKPIGEFILNADLPVVRWDILASQTGQVFVTVEGADREEHNLRMFSLFNRPKDR